MGSYQLKVIIRGSKPPIWRRMIVPEETSFTALSKIIQISFGWAGYHLSEFLIPDTGEYIVPNPSEEDEFFEREMPIKDGAQCFLKDYLKGRKYITYVYDFGDDWEHRIEIEKFLEKEIDAPEVIKFKGENLMEDSGGIDGYYELVQRMKDPNDPEQEMLLEWGEIMGYGEAYDIETVNDDLSMLDDLDMLDELDMFNDEREMVEEKIIPAEVEKMLDELVKIFLVEKRVPKSQQKEVGEHIREMLLETLIRDDGSLDTSIFEEKPEIVGVETSLGFREILNNLTKDSTKEMCKNHGFGGYHGMKKDALIDFFIESVTAPGHMSHYFGALIAEEEENWQALIKGESLDDGYAYLQLLSTLGYVFYNSNNELCVPKDVIAAYEKMTAGENWKAEHQMLRKMRRMLQACGHLYGVFTMERYLEMLKDYEGITLEKVDLIQTFFCYLMEYVPISLEEGQYFMAKELMGYYDVHTVLNKQEDLPYYLPTLEELEKMEILPILLMNDAVSNLGKTMINQWHQDEATTLMLCYYVQEDFRTAIGIDKICEYFDGVVPNTKKEKKHLDTLIADMQKNTRSIFLCGYTPNEVQQMKNPKPLPDNIIKFPGKYKM